MSNILGSDSNDPRLNYQHNSIDRKNEFVGDYDPLIGDNNADGHPQY